jgi:hypothetical protein
MKREVAVDLGVALLSLVAMWTPGPAAVTALEAALFLACAIRAGATLGIRPSRFKVYDVDSIRITFAGVEIKGPYGYSEPVFIRRPK